MPTLKQFAYERFFSLLDEYKVALRDFDDSPEKKNALIRVSLQIHQAKAGVPKRYWSLVNKAYRESNKK